MKTCRSQAGHYNNFEQLAEDGEGAIRQPGLESNHECGLRAPASATPFGT
jgi:hypothetical protein